MASTQLITDAASLVGTFAAESTAKALAAAGPIQDLDGNARLVTLKLQEAKVLLTQMKAATDSGDGNLTVINGMLDSLD